jgi:predicted metalloprotease
MGIGGAVVLLVLSLIFHRNFFALFNGGGSAATNDPSAVQQAPPANESPEEHKEAEFVSFVAGDTQATWEQLLKAEGVPYRKAKLVLFRDATPSGCGYAQSASGPFYCPQDEKVYIDLAFYDELKQRFGAPGDFAQAYVIAHEMGHHVQNILGIAPKVHDAMEARPRQANELSVRLELQADCFAGIWARSTQQRNLLESGDVDEGMAAAAAVGDDRIQRMAGKRVNPDSFTHGSAQQRTQWFRTGFNSGRISDCDTFR